MTPDERAKLETAVNAEGGAYASRLVCFDRIGDSPDNLAINIVAHYGDRETRQGRTASEITNIRDFARPVLGRELREDEITIRAIGIPKQQNGIVLGSS
jgi:hypothetical protein